MCSSSSLGACVLILLFGVCVCVGVVVVLLLLFGVRVC